MDNRTKNWTTLAGALSGAMLKSGPTQVNEGAITKLPHEWLRNLVRQCQEQGAQWYALGASHLYPDQEHITHNWVEQGAFALILSGGQLRFGYDRTSAALIIQSEPSAHWEVEFSGPWVQWDDGLIVWIKEEISGMMGVQLS